MVSLLARRLSGLSNSAMLPWSSTITLLLSRMVLSLGALAASLWHNSKRAELYSTTLMCSLIVNVIKLAGMFNLTPSPPSLWYHILVEDPHPRSRPQNPRQPQGPGRGRCRSGERSGEEQPRPRLKVSTSSATSGGGGACRWECRPSVRADPENKSDFLNFNLFTRKD